MFNSAKDLLTSSSVLPLLEVFARMVWTAFICVSYSWKPDFMGSMVNADINFFPVFMAEVVILLNAVIAITSNAENFILTVSVALPNEFISTLLAALLILLKPSWTFSNLNDCFNFSSDDKVVLVPDSNCWLSNFIWTTLCSISVLINVLPPSKQPRPFRQI